MFKTMLGILLTLTVSSSWASVVDCRFEDIYFKYNGADKFDITTDEGRHSSGKAQGNQLGYSYYLIEELVNNKADKKILITVDLHRSITRDTFESVMSYSTLEMRQSCWDGCDNVTWGWETTKEVKGVCRL